MKKFILSLVITMSSLTVKSSETIPSDITNHTIDILFLYANYDATARHDTNYTPRWEIENKVIRNIQEANQAFAKSNVNMVFRSVGIEEVVLPKDKMGELTDRILNSEHLSSVNRWTYPILKPIFDKRFQKNADVVVFVDIKASASRTNGANRFGGKYNPYVRINNGDFNSGVFIHEVCHLFGLTHEMGATFPYNQSLAGKRTIMATNCAQTENNLNKDLSLMFSGATSYDGGTHFYSECNWDSATVLREQAYALSRWSDDVKYGDLPNHDFVPATFTDISVANECTSWGIDERGRLWQWDRYEWTEVKTDRRFKSLSAKDWENVFLVDDFGTFITYNAYTKVFGMIITPEKVKEIATNSSGNIYILSVRNEVYLRDLTSNGQNNWQNIPSPFNNIKDIQLSDSGSLWGLEFTGEVLEYSHNNWVYRSRMRASDLSVGRDGTVGIINLSDGKIYIAESGSYNFIQRDNNVPAMCNCDRDFSRCQSKIIWNMADKLSVYNSNRIWALASTRVYKYVGNNGFQEVYEYAQIHKRMHIN